MPINAAGYPFAVLAHFAFVLAGLLIYAVGTHMSGQRRHPSAALAWVLTIALLPYVGLPLYLVLGTRKFTRQPQGGTLNLPCSDDIPQSGALSTSKSALIATLEGMGLAPPANNRRVHFHQDGQMAWDELAALINNAQLQLDVCTFLLGNDALAQGVKGLLKERAAAGVNVRLLLDALGSWRTSSADVRGLRAAGVQVQWYVPLLSNLLRGRGNLRNHRKLVIADGQRLWSGGRNLAGEYFTGKDHQPPWIDLSFTLEGPLAGQAQNLFDSHWRHTNEPAKSNKHQNAQTPVIRDVNESPIKHRAQMVPSGPDQAQDTFYGLLLTALFRAERRVLAVTPYFVPDDSLLTALCLAAQRGVQVELIVPRRSNHRLADIARARALRDLVAAGGKVSLAPGMVHAKALVVDDSVAFCGSLNLDSRSLFLNYELMLAFYDREDIEAVTHWMDKNFSGLPGYQPTQPSLLRDVAEGLVRWLGFQI